MLVEHPVALARADKNLKKDIPWISVSAVGMFLGSPTDIQRIGPMSEIDIFWTSTGLTCVMWVTTLYHDIVEGGFFLTWNSAAVLFTNLSACSAALTVLIIQKFYQDWGPITALTFRTDGALIMITGSSQGHLAI